MGKIHSFLHIVNDSFNVNFFIIVLFHDFGEYSLYKMIWKKFFPEKQNE